MSRTPDPDSDGDPEKKKQNKAIEAKRKRQFLIEIKFLKASNGRLRGTMKCELKQYERGTDLTIVEWINQIKTHYTISQILAEAFVKCMLMKIVLKRLSEIKEYQNLDFIYFWINCLKSSKKTTKRPPT